MELLASCRVLNRDSAVLEIQSQQFVNSHMTSYAPAFSRTVPDM